jgi:hypothetical protein
MAGELTQFSGEGQADNGGLNDSGMAKGGSIKGNSIGIGRARFGKRT